MTPIAILGSTGSIGRSAFEVARALHERFQIVALAAEKNWKILADQAKSCGAKRVALASPAAAEKLRSMGLDGLEVLSGEGAVEELAASGESDAVVCGVAGAAGLRPALAAVRAGKRLAIANKEPLVMAGEALTREAEASGAEIVPVDSEHSAIFQAMRAGGPEDVRRIILTASGGPFLETPLEELAGVTVKDALAHPRWSMGKKITVDSATMMNKALEVIEARWLFGVGFDAVEVWVHPQVIVHGMVEFVDGSMVAQMGLPDMRLPIQYALTHPERLEGGLRAPRVEEMSSLSFRPVDPERFPAVRLGYRAGKTGGTAPAVLSAANEEAVRLFLEGSVPFTAIVELVESALDSHRPLQSPDLDGILRADAWARDFVNGHVEAGTWRG